MVVRETKLGVFEFDEIEERLEGIKEEELENFPEEEGELHVFMRYDDEGDEYYSVDSVSAAREEALKVLEETLKEGGGRPIQFEWINWLGPFRGRFEVEFFLRGDDVYFIVSHPVEKRRIIYGKMKKEKFESEILPGIRSILKERDQKSRLRLARGLVRYIFGV